MGRIATGERVGLLGGTFDPPHLGHLWLAETARDQLQLSRVLFLPVGSPPHKKGQAVTSIEHRREMVRLAIEACDSFQLDLTDAMRTPPHTTVTLLEELHQMHPHWDYWLLLGSDSLRDLPSWHRPQELSAWCRLAVLPRHDIDIDWTVLQAAIPSIQATIDWLEGPTLAISSSDLRHWARRGNSLQFLLPAAVWHYIQRHRLY